MEPISPPVQNAASSLPIMTVGELTSLVKGTLRSAPRLRNLWVEGEVGQVSISAAGHCYFTLKDDRAQLRCVIFRDDRLMMPFEARTGLRLVAHGHLDVFEPQGAYQLYVESLQPSGFGDLALRFEALKAKLAAEGLFESARKRPLPPFPLTIGVVTSLSGAVLHDIRRVLARRWPLARVVVSACQVQGNGAAQTIVAALRRVARWTDPETGRATDVVILARGGGSLEDLWPFNEEAVVRAVAAELIVPSRTDERGRLDTLASRMRASAARSLADRRQQLNAETRALDTLRPDAVLAAERERIGLLLDRAARVLQRRLEIDRTALLRQSELLPGLALGRLTRDRAELSRQSAALSALSPFATLERGYSIVRGPDGAVLRDPRRVQRGDPISVRLQHGELGARVEEVPK